MTILITLITPPGYSYTDIQVLDYFNQQRKVIQADHIIFNWEHDTGIGIGSPSDNPLNNPSNNSLITL